MIQITRRQAILTAIASPFFLAKAEGKTAVDTIMVLALDVSGSMTLARWNVEKNGYAAAFSDPDIIEQIQSGFLGKIAVAVVQWSFCTTQKVSIEWVVIDDQVSAIAFAKQLRNMQRAFAGGTCPAGGMLYSATLIEQAPFTARRRIINVSGDGPDSQWASVQSRVITAKQARDTIVARGITINGLPILSEPLDNTVGNEVSPPPSIPIEEYYRDNIIGGPSSFLVVVRDANDTGAFTEAARQKLGRELIAQR